MTFIRLKFCAAGLAATAVSMLATGAALADQGTAADVTSGPSLPGILSHTPFWVWVVLIGLLYLGLRGARERTVGLAGFVVFPLLLVLLSLYNLAGTHFAMIIVAGLGVGGLFGLAAGIGLERPFPPTSLGNGRLRLKGEWTGLVTVLVVFLTRYVTGIVNAVDPVLAQSDGFELTTASISAFFAVMLVSRLVLRLRVALAPAAAAAPTGSLVS